MKTKCLILLILISFIACKSYLPFSNKEEKKEKVSLIKKKLNLKNSQYVKIKKHDSVLFSISNSLEKDIKLSLISRRLDSFLVENYTKKELLFILDIDRQFPDLDPPMEFDRRKNVKQKNFKNMKDFKKFVNNIDGEIEKALGMKKKDSAKQQKKQ